MPPPRLLASVQGNRTAKPGKVPCSAGMAISRRPAEPRQPGPRMPRRRCVRTAALGTAELRSAAHDFRPGCRLSAVLHEKRMDPAFQPEGDAHAMHETGVSHGDI